MLRNSITETQGTRTTKWHKETENPDIEKTPKSNPGVASHARYITGLDSNVSGLASEEKERMSAQAQCDNERLAYSLSRQMALLQARHDVPDIFAQYTRAQANEIFPILIRAVRDFSIIRLRQEKQHCTADCTLEMSRQFGFCW